MAFIKKFRQEFEDHLDGKPCHWKATSGTGVEIRSLVVGDTTDANDFRPTPNDHDDFMADVNITVDGKKSRLRLGLC